MIVYSVGNEFPVESQNLNKYLGGVILDFIGGTPCQIFYYPRPHPKEIGDCKSGKIEFRYISNKEKGFYIILVKVGAQLAELVFNPNLYHDNRVQDYMKNRGNLYQIFMVDSLTNRIASMRAIGLTDKIKDKLYEIWTDMINKKVDQTELTEWVESLYINFTGHELWDRAEVIGRFKAS